MMADSSDYRAITLLDNLYWIALRESRLGATILWNACYHLECHSLPFRGRIPTFNQQWHAIKDVNSQ